MSKSNSIWLSFVGMGRTFNAKLHLDLSPLMVKVVFENGVFARFIGFCAP